MRKMDKDGLLLCDIQGKIFEQSATLQQCSSGIFIRRYMNSRFCVRMDKGGYLYEATSIPQIFDEIEEEYGKSTYGKVIFSKDELYWIGYLYRYFAYVYEIRSQQIYKIITGSELRRQYYPYHTMDPLFAIERILEAREINLCKTKEEITRQGIEILRNLRGMDSKQ